MNEIVRIQIAKNPYEIEKDAKKVLDGYINKLELYADDQDWLQDIEIRITELLNERGIQRDGIISRKDVTAIREQLGEPQEFLGEGDIAIGPELEKANTHRLYRDMDTAVLGGVLSGIAKYFDVSAIWTRLIFLVLLVLSFGFISTVYAVLWVIIPPAKTIAEKLQLAGKPVTLATMKALREQQGDDRMQNKIAQSAQRILLYGAGAMSAFCAIGALVMTTFGGVKILSDSAPGYPFSEIVSESWTAWVAYGLFIASGILLASLFATTAYALFKKTLAKRVVIAVISIIIAGIATFGFGIGSVMYASRQADNREFDSRFTKNADLPNQFASINTLIVDTAKLPSTEFSEYNDAQITQINYVVSTGKPYYKVSLNASTATLQPIIKLSDDGKTATLTLDSPKNRPRYGTRLYTAPVVTVYGPALDNITIASGIVRYHNNVTQDNLGVSSEMGMFELTGTYKDVTVYNKSSVTTLSGASIENLTLSYGGGNISAGTVRTLSVTQPDSCPSDSSHQSRLSIDAVSGGKVNYNGIEQPARTLINTCGAVIIGDKPQETQ